MTGWRRYLTYARLGLSNLVRVGLYRVGLKSGLHPVTKVVGVTAVGPFFRDSERRGQLPTPNESWDDTVWYFGRPNGSVPEVPDWFSNPFSELPQPDASRVWWEIPDFGAGDIKGLWEISRFDWALAWATKAAHGDAKSLARLNRWLADWAEMNPPYRGPNWKCGQEASIRVLHLIVAAWILGQDEAIEKGLADLIQVHLQRIAPTMSYAIGQQNNHGTSEAAALFIGGSLIKNTNPRGDQWARMGRHWLEERARCLILPDGSFSQYSVSYHRLMLDTYSLVEAWRIHRNLPRFSDKLVKRLRAATRWLEAMTDVKSGDAPNLGANDGADLLPIEQRDHRDFRSSVQLAAALFENRDPYGEGTWNQLLRWLEVAPGLPAGRRKSESFDNGGYHVLRRRQITAILRYPRFHFRPSQADALHLDLWWHGRNILRDAGSYSYNSDKADWYASCAAHNTVEFDGHDQMPRLGRFLFGDWLRASVVEAVQENEWVSEAAAGYRDAWGAYHYRHLTLSEAGLVCVDQLDGNARQAVMRWRLEPGAWVHEGNMISNREFEIEISSEKPISISMTSAPQSRYYFEETSIPVVEISTSVPSQIRTSIRISSNAMQ